MIFGLGKGKIRIDLDKSDFSPGETIKGKVSLEIKKSIPARQLKVTLVGIRITTQQIITQKGPTTKTKRSTIHHSENSLAEEKQYFKGEYPFKIKIPADILQKSSTSKGVLGILSKAAEVLKGVTETSSRIEWHLEASLDIPKAFDIKKRVQINIK